MYGWYCPCRLLLCLYSFLYRARGVGDSYWGVVLGRAAVQTLLCNTDNRFLQWSRRFFSCFAWYRYYYRAQLRSSIAAFC